MCVWFAFLFHMFKLQLVILSAAVHAQSYSKLRPRCLPLGHKKMKNDSGRDRLSLSRAAFSCRQSPASISAHCVTCGVKQESYWQ